TVDLGECPDDLERGREIELQAAMTSRHEHAVDANGPQRLHQIWWDPPSSLDLRSARGDVRCQVTDIGEQTLGRVGAGKRRNQVPPLDRQARRCLAIASIAISRPRELDISAIASFGLPKAPSC